MLEPRQHVRLTGLYNVLDRLRAGIPPDDIAQTGLVMNALIASGAALDAATIAGAFKQGRKVMPAISSVLVSLYRMGLISTQDGGKTFAYRRAA